ncbi:alpha/beta fold hydrolase [Thalassotalea sp. M1531]|uniref:Alpha/beta fold hydrolase n=1 Tax=Thalassotalea algicola TaxID=2716224 RepID=A0A7Y0LB41_9GAMM|nr:alpha/beta hydrolase [Thalassotalea algicola]NMP31072.1 alpha/beta fold hydrolase [Thalassotalea algicola]
MLPKGVFVSGTGPAIIFLHSSLSSSRQWFPLVKQLESNFTCINIDILGYGVADKVQDVNNYDFSVEAKRINQAIEHVVGDGQYHLVGHSCGGAIALKIAVEAPEKVLSMSLYEPVAFHLLPEGSEEQKAACDFAQYVDIEDTYKAAAVFTDFWNKEGFFEALPDKMKALMAADMPKVNLDFKGLMSEKYTLSDLKTITAPCLMITGKLSPHLSHYLAKHIIASLPAAEHKQVAAGHMAPVSHSEIVLPLIGEFICHQ